MSDRLQQIQRRVVAWTSGFYAEDVGYLLEKMASQEAEIAHLREQHYELKAEHQCCLDGDTAWAEKWRAKVGELEAELSAVRQAIQQALGFHQTTHIHAILEKWVSGVGRLGHAEEVRK